MCLSPPVCKLRDECKGFDRLCLLQSPGELAQCVAQSKCSVNIFEYRQAFIRFLVFLSLLASAFGLQPLSQTSSSSTPSGSGLFTQLRENRLQPPFGGAGGTEMFSELSKVIEPGLELGSFVDSQARAFPTVPCFSVALGAAPYHASSQLTWAMLNPDPATS